MARQIIEMKKYLDSKKNGKSTTQENEITKVEENEIINKEFSNCETIQSKVYLIFRKIYTLRIIFPKKRKKMIYQTILIQLQKIQM